MTTEFEDSMLPLLGMPGFSYFMGFNLSGLCATTRLLNCREVGLETANVLPKFMKDPSEVPDLPREDFLVRKRLVRKMQSEPGMRDWKPILYIYELYKGVVKDPMDYGHMVWTDNTLTRYLLVNLYPFDRCPCGDPTHNDWLAVMNLQAQRFLNLLVYLQGNDGPRPRWVRATYVTLTNLNWDAQFVADRERPSPSADPAVVHLTPADLKPSLRAKDLLVIDNTLARDPAYKDLVRPEDRARVLTTHVDLRVAPNGAGMAVHRTCAGCNKPVDIKDLKKCSRCRLASYCGPSCQRAHWPLHKKVCVQSNSG